MGVVKGACERVSGITSGKTSGAAWKNARTFAKQTPPASIPNAGGSYPGAITRLLTCKLTADFADSDDVACVAVLVSVELFHEIREFC